MTETFEEEKIKVPLNGPLIYAKKGTFQDTIDALLCHIHLNVCLWIMDPHHRAPKKNTSHGNEVLPQDTTRLIQRHNTNEEVRAKIQQAIGPHEDLLTIVKRPNCSGVVMSPVHQVWPKPSCKAEWKGEDDKADRGRGGKTTSGNGRAWSSPSPRGQWRTGENGGNWLWNHLWCPNDPRGWGIDDDDDVSVQRQVFNMSCLRVETCF